MNTRRQNIITEMANMMTEQIPAPGMTSGGGAEAQSAMNMLPGSTAQPDMTLDLGCEVEENEQFQPEHVQAAKDLIAMVGGADKARELIDKVDDALEVFENGADEEQAIDLVASLMPDMADIPMQKSITRISSMFDPSAQT